MKKMSKGFLYSTGGFDNFLASEMIYYLKSEGIKAMTVYLDVLFFVNFIMDYLVISLTGVLAATRLGKRKKLISSLLGASLGVVHFVFIKSAAVSLIFGVCMPLPIVLSALYPCGRKLYLRCLLFYPASAFLISGAAEFMLNIFGIEGSGLTSHIVWLTAGLLYLLIKNIHAALKAGAMSGEHKITVKYGEYSVTRSAALDTGNTLTDPITNRPVIVADEDILSGLFAAGCTVMNITEWINPLDLRIIPYRTIDKEGAMTGFAPTAVIIDGRPVPDAIIAISAKKIKGGVLLNSAMM